MARQTQDTCDVDKARAIPRTQLFRSFKKERENRFRRGRALKNDFPRILSLKRSYLSAAIEIVSCYFHISNFNPEIHGHTSLHAEEYEGTGWKGRESAIHICRSEIRTPPPSIPRLEVIITYIRQLTRVHPLPPPWRSLRAKATLTLWNRKQFRIQYRGTPTAPLW